MFVGSTHLECNARARAEVLRGEVAWWVLWAPRMEGRRGNCQEVYDPGAIGELSPRKRMNVQRYTVPNGAIGEL